MNGIDYIYLAYYLLYEYSRNVSFSRVLFYFFFFFYMFGYTLNWNVIGFSGNFVFWTKNDPFGKLSVKQKNFKYLQKCISHIHNPVSLFHKSWAPIVIPTSFYFTKSYYHTYLLLYWIKWLSIILYWTRIYCCECLSSFFLVCRSIFFYTLSLSLYDVDYRTLYVIFFFVVVVFFFTFIFLYISRYFFRI